MGVRLAAIALVALTTLAGAPAASAAPGHTRVVVCGPGESESAAVRLLPDADLGCTVLFEHDQAYGSDPALAPFCAALYRSGVPTLTLGNGATSVEICPPSPAPPPYESALVDGRVGGARIAAHSTYEGCTYGDGVTAGGIGVYLVRSCS